MGTRHRKCVFFIVTLADKTAAELEITDVDSQSVESMRVPLSDDGNEPATHYACSTMIIDSDLDYLESNFPAGATVYRGHNTYDKEAVTKYTFSEVLSDMGLIRIEPTA